MKELDRELHADKIEITGQNEVNKAEFFIGSVMPKPGQFYWQLSLDTWKITKAELSQERIELIPEVNPLTNQETGKLISIKRRDLMTKDYHWYTLAINAKNAKRKFLNRIKNATEKNQVEQSN